MAAVDSSSLSSVSLQRKRFELLGVAYSQGRTIKNWMKALIITVLVVGLPSLPLLSHPLKDPVITRYQMLIWGVRILIFSFMFYWVLKISTHLMAAKSDFQTYINHVGYNLPDTNSAEEIKFVQRKIIFTTIQYLALFSSFFGIFLLNNRTNYGYLIGQEIIYTIIVISLLLTVKFWAFKGSKESPWLGARYLLLMLLPSMYVWGLEVFIDFFTAIDNPRFSFNVLQLNWGLVYPIVFLLVVFATWYTTQKTKREKMALRQAWEIDYKRKLRYIREKNKIFQGIFWLRVQWHQLLSFLGIEKSKVKKEQEDLDKRPNPIIVRSIWLSLFITIIPVSFLTSWILFPYDNIVILTFLLTAYTYSMIKYHREPVEVVVEVESNVKTEPPEIRKASFIQDSYLTAMIPVFIFAITTLLLNGVITKGILVGQKAILAMSLSWIGILAIIPLSIRLYLYLDTTTNISRSKESLKLYRRSYLVIGLYVVLFFIGLIAAYIASLSMDFEYIPDQAFAMYALILAAFVVLPISYIYIVSALKDESQKKILNIVNIILLTLLNIGVMIWFIITEIVNVFIF